MVGELLAEAILLDDDKHIPLELREWQTYKTTPKENSTTPKKTLRREKQGEGRRGGGEENE
jgi:hypothetical protein